MAWILLLLALVLLAAMPLWLEHRRTPVGEAQRRTAPGGFAGLSGGVTHYRWWGREGGPVLVLVHGLNTSSYVFDSLVDELIAQGWRVLTYDLYGRGLSDRPGTRQTRAFFTRQLRELLQDQGVENGFVLAGYSLGGGIATVFASEEPERLKALVLFAPSGFTDAPAPFAEFCRKTPYLGDWVHSVFGGWQMRKRLKAGVTSTVPDLGARQIAETETRGFLRSILSTRRHMLTERLAEEHSDLAAVGLPTLAIWGEDDRLVPPRAMAEMVQAHRAARQVTIPGAGHGLVHTHPRDIARAMQEFFWEVRGR